MSNHTHQTVPTQFIEAKGVCYAHRRFGKPGRFRSSFCIREWGTIPTTNRYATLKDITPPTLIIHGNKDVVVMPINALILAEHLPNAQLIVYSDSSHGTQYQHARHSLST